MPADIEAVALVFLSSRNATPQCRMCLDHGDGPAPGRQKIRCGQARGAAANDEDAGISTAVS
jgi:hypothetical protein